jgi:hypothetical protein
VVAHPALDGRAPTLQAVARVGILLHVGVVETMPHNEVWFHELGEGLILKRVVHDRPAHVRIFSVALATYARSKVIGKPLGIDAVVELQAELPAHTRAHILPATMVKGADGGTHAQRKQASVMILDLEFLLGAACAGESQHKDNRDFPKHGA